MIRYVFSTKQMHDLDHLHHRKSNELNTQLQRTHKYSKLPKDNEPAYKNIRKIKANLDLYRTTMQTRNNNQKRGQGKGPTLKRA